MGHMVQLEYGVFEINLFNNAIFHCEMLSFGGFATVCFCAHGSYIEALLYNYSSGRNVLIFPTYVYYFF